MFTKNLVSRVDILTLVNLTNCIQFKLNLIRQKDSHLIRHARGPKEENLLI